MNPGPLIGSSSPSAQSSSEHHRGRSHRVAHRRPCSLIVIGGTVGAVIVHSSSPRA